MKKVKLTESDLTHIIERVMKESEMEEQMDMDMDNEGGIPVTLEHIAMLLKDGSCECGGQRLVLDLEMEDDDEYEDEDEEFENDEEVIDYM